MALTKTLKKYLGFTKIDVYTVQLSLCKLVTLTGIEIFSLKLSNSNIFQKVYIPQKVFEVTTPIKSKYGKLKV